MLLKKDLQKKFKLSAKDGAGFQWNEHEIVRRFVL